MRNNRTTGWILRVVGFLITYHLSLVTSPAQDNRTFNQIDESGTITQRNGNDNGNFNKHNNDTTKNKEIPKGHYVWTVDRKFGDITPATPDTLHHLFLNTTFNTGIYGDYNTTGSNYTARQSRIFINRPESSSFIFTDPYSFFFKQPDEFLFVNTLSPYTCVTYDNCGDKQNGEDRIDAKFAVNANKRLGFGFDLNYDYARGYFSNQSVAHFGGTIFTSYLGDRYQMHILLTANHQKATENGGITDDEYITHPESFQDNYAENEIPTVLSQNWNRNDNQHVFFSHRYNIGFYRLVKMTEDELKARKFAEESKKDKEKQEEQSKGRDEKQTVPKGRPTGAAIVGNEPKAKTDSLAAITDSTRIQVAGQAAIDSLNRAQALQDSIDATMKKEYVPVTSFIHTLELHNYKRIYQAYDTPNNYYLNGYIARGQEYGNDSIYDETKHLQVKNTFGIALLEGFNKYMKAGLKGFITHEHRKYKMPDLVADTDSCYQNSWSENNISVGGLLSRARPSTSRHRRRLGWWVKMPGN